MSRQLLRLRSGASATTSHAGGRNINIFSGRRVNRHFDRNKERSCSSSWYTEFSLNQKKSLCSVNLGQSKSFSSFQPLFSNYVQKEGQYSVVKTGQTKERRHDHPISQRLISARTTDEVVSVLEEDAESMDVVTISVAVDVLFDALKSEIGLTTKLKHQILTSVGVQKLCKLLRRSGPRMDAADLINGVKILCFLSAPGNHQTLQVLLKLLTKHANHMDLQQIMYTNFLLDKLEASSKSALSKALEYALPVVFESQLASQLDKSDPVMVCDCLHYATRYKCSQKTIDTLIEAAANLTDRFSTKSAMSLMWSLCAVPFDNLSHEPLVTWAYKKITDGINSFKLSDLTMMLGRTLRKYNANSVKAAYFYNELFLDAYCQKQSASETAELDTLWSLRQISIFRHVNIDLVDRIGEIIASNPSHILNDDNLYVIVTRAFANLNYKPENWSIISSILLEHPSLGMNNNIGYQEILQVEDFLELDLFPEHLIRSLYSVDGLPVLEEFQERHHPIKLLTMYNAIKVLYPQYQGPFPPISMVENWKELSRAKNADKQYPLKPALQTGLGGDSYVINGLYHEGIHIDHGIVMRKGGYPVAVNSQSDSQLDCLSNISKPAHSVIVLIKAYTKEHYLNNTRRLRGLAALELKVIEKLGNPVVLVDLEQWVEMPDQEKIPYLMQRIREKMEMEHIQWNKNWGDVIPP